MAEPAPKGEGTSELAQEEQKELPAGPDFTPGFPGLRTRPPWPYGDHESPSLRVGYDPCTAEYIIRATGGHIIAATRDLVQVGQLIQHEALRGYGAVEYLCTRKEMVTTYGGLASRSNAVGRQPARRANTSASGGANISLSDLDIPGITAPDITLEDLDIEL